MVFAEFMGSYVNDPDGDAAKGYKYPDSPVMDPRVRKALSKAIDREALNKLFLNEGVPMYVKFHNEEADGAGFNPDWKARFQDEYGYDPAAARDLLAAAGYSASRPLQITIELQNGALQLPEQNDVLEAIGEMWRAVGVQPTLETLDISAYITKQRALGFDNHVYLFGAGQPQNFVYQRVLTARRQQRGQGFENYEFEKTYYDFIHALEPAKHDELWRGVGDLDFGQHQAIPLFWLYQEFVGDPKVISAFEFSGTSALVYNWMWNVKAA
jgi:peptide/nickel transport system substrate-binding protein